MHEQPEHNPAQTGRHARADEDQLHRAGGAEEHQFPYSQRQSCQFSKDDLMILLQAMYHYREEYRLGGDELEVLRKLTMALGATEEECAQETA